jgi:hypothetical protein
MGAQGSGRKLSAAPMVAAEDTELWEMQPDESESAFRAFCLYRDMGADRRLKDVTAALEKRPEYIAQVGKWSSDHHWVQRVRAWDSHQDRLACAAALEAKQEAAKQMVKRHLLISEHLQSMASVELMRWLNRLKISVPEPDLARRPKLGPKTIQMLLDYAIKLERLNRDEPESIQEVRDKKLDPDLLEQRIKHLLGARED